MFRKTKRQMEGKIVDTIINRYLKIINIVGEPNEKYKYDAINQFQENWDLESSDFSEMFKRSFSKVGNLLYQNSWGFIYKSAEVFPEDVREMFRNLYTENIDLEVRIQNFQEESNRLLPLLKDNLERDNLNSQQDERTISIYLGFRHPEKYCFYKYSYYNEFSKEFNLESGSKNGFINLQNYLAQFHEVLSHRDDFITLYRSYYPKPEWDDTNLMIQNILYVSYRADLTGIYNGILKNFTKENLIIYFSYLEEILNGIGIKKGSQKYVFNISDKQINFTIGQKYVWCLKSDVNEEYFKVIGNGTFGYFSDKFNSAINSYLNHFKDVELLALHEKEIDDAISTVLQKTVRSGYYKYNDPFIERMAFDRDFRLKVLEYDLPDEINTKTNYWIFQGNPNYYDVVGALKNTSITSWKVASHKDKIKIGDKFILWLTGNESGVYSLGEVTSEVGKIKTDEKELTFYKTEFNPNEDRVEIKITHNFVDNPILLKNIQNNSVLESMKVGNQGTNFSATKEQYEELIRLSQIKKTTMNYPLNQILFGCPGSGKTYTTKKIAVEIIEDRKFSNTKEEREEILELYEKYIISKQIRFTTFHQSLSYEDFIEGIKPKLGSVSTQDIEYEVRNGIFKLICIDADQKKTSTNFEESYEKFVEEVSEVGSLVLHSLTHKKPFDVRINSNQNCTAIPHTETRTNMVITKKMVEEYVINGKIIDWKTYGSAIGEYIKNKYHITVENSNNQKKKYVIIMDEINRGNVSSIFGELITLIEDDKRKGCKEEIYVDLPYSQKPFSVPNNVYLLGTMNTADRSVESLDTALRRRFSFVEMKANPEVLRQGHVNGGIITGTNINLIDLLKCINERIELLIDKDHQIGHSYFIGVNSLSDLKYVFKNKIIPLLEEYFYGDFGKIGLVLGDKFVTTNSTNENKKILAKFKGYDDIDFLADKKIYSFCDINSMDESVFISIYKVTSALQNNEF